MFGSVHDIGVGDVRSWLVRGRTFDDASVCSHWSSRRPRVLVGTRRRWTLHGDIAAHLSPWRPVSTVTWLSRVMPHLQQVKGRLLCF